MRILYGVAGEGSGHAIRSKVIIGHLLNNHEVLVVCGGNAFPILSKICNPCQVYSHKIVFENSSLNNQKTVACNLLNIHKSINSIKHLIDIVKEFKPNLIITDFEPYCAHASNLLRIPCISLDNIHIQKKANLEIKGHILNRISQKLIAYLFVPKANYYLITTFFYPPINKGNIFLFPPILRKEILETKTKNKKFGLIYQSIKKQSILKDLKKINKNFRIYGAKDKYEKDKNLIFKPFDEREFVKDISECEFVICNGGFTTIAEALHLKKPVLSIPIKKHFEQMTNAFYLEKLGYGKNGKELNKETLNNFISNLKVYKRNLIKYKKEDNKKLLKKLDEIIKIYNQA
jgi:uncharacterized protein (TIGR00661 family)